MKISKDMKVSLNYDLIDEKGVIIDSSRDDEPLEYIQGYGFLVEGLELELEGKKAGDHFETTIPPELGYGIRDKELVYVIDKKEFGEQADALIIGQEVDISSPDGDFIVTVVAMTKETITLDANHPLADMPLKFNVDILEVSKATEAEIEEFLEEPEYEEHDCCDDDDDDCCCSDDCDCSDK